MIGSNLFLSFNPKTQRIDEFFIKHMSADSFPKLLTVVKLLLLLSHGQASVERGFSVNKETIADNLSQKALVGRRVICDHVRTVGGVLNVSIAKELMQSVSFSRKKYEQHLKQNKQEKTTKEREQKRKHIQDEADELHQQQKRIKLDIESLRKTADTYYEKAESTGDLSHVTKGNALISTPGKKPPKVKRMLKHSLITMCFTGSDLSMEKRYNCSVCLYSFRAFFSLIK